MTEHLVMNIALILVCVVIVGTIVAFIANTINTPRITSAEPIKPCHDYATTRATYTTTCDCDDKQDIAFDIALIKCFQDIARDKELSPEINEKARIALLAILEDYQPEDEDDDEEDEGATVVTAPEKTTDDPKPV
jgi:hypothetical protein